MEGLKDGRMEGVVEEAQSNRMCYKHDRGKRGGGGYAPESSVQKLYTPQVQGYLVFGFLALFITLVNISRRSGSAKRNP